MLLSLRAIDVLIAVYRMRGGWVEVTKGEAVPFWTKPLNLKLAKTLALAASTSWRKTSNSSSIREQYLSHRERVSSCPRSHGRDCLASLFLQNRVL